MQKADDSVLTEAFGVGWPDAPHRVLRSSIDARRPHPGDAIGETVSPVGDLLPMVRFGASSPNRDTTGDISGDGTVRRTLGRIGRQDHDRR